MRWLKLKHVLAFCLLLAAVNYINLTLVRRMEGPPSLSDPNYQEYLRWRSFASRPGVFAADLALVGVAFWWVARRHRTTPNHPAALVVFGMALGNLLGLLMLVFLPQ
jgi:hypothetical protein